MRGNSVKKEASDNRPRPDYFRLYSAALLSLVYFAAFSLSGAGGSPLAGKMLKAARLMAEAEKVLAACKEKAGFPLDEAADPNRTGLIGVETSDITTSLGNLQAKRTSTNPDFAALLVYLAAKAGVRQGDYVAVGASSSFPALILASVVAAETLGAKPVLIVSLGSSEWGANQPGFGWLEMEDCLRRAGLVGAAAAGVSLGGDEDAGGGMSEAVRQSLLAKIQGRGLMLIEGGSLEDDVRQRLRAYRIRAGLGRLALFINIGGNWANLGRSSSVLKLKPGLLGKKEVSTPEPGESGVLQAMTGRGVPVIHLLNIKGLAERYGLPWDPKPPPTPGDAGVYLRARRESRLFAVISGLYLAAMFGLLLGRRRHSLSF